MKKLISMLSTLFLTTTSVLSINACTGDKNSSSSSNENNQQVDKKVDLNDIPVKILKHLSNSLEDAKAEAVAILKNYNSSLKEGEDYNFDKSYFSRSTPLYSGWLKVVSLEKSKIIKGYIIFALEYVDDRISVNKLSIPNNSTAYNEEAWKSIVTNALLELNTNVKENIDYTFSDIEEIDIYGRFLSGHVYATRNSIYLKGETYQINIKKY
ncbi:hypothetical protein [Spiroplasma tabanidicola]|uniref:Lipoprotein n=1 Tax=Spiroplasma tabanidicola TaxID=324079 RepID=A0A6I6C6J8_9MOLU|nr:hypothetical protein [Spiroplasma tabanidicola]QGS51416.1 hypothetical protein STABA_v1c00490 [Spiroplasma tabanidicola]